IVVLLLILRLLFLEECRECFNQMVMVFQVVTGSIGFQTTSTRRVSVTANHQTLPRRSFFEDLQNSPCAALILKAPHHNRIIDV
ncbi:hypothetical protein PENTCL1PPCAC_17038, partial [Pristionchus entomophagus]